MDESDLEVIVSVTVETNCLKDVHGIDINKLHRSLSTVVALLLWETLPKGNNVDLTLINKNTFSYEK